MADGAYNAERAAALSGVPSRTLYDWARKGRLVPSGAVGRPALWSLSDLMIARTMYWLRHEKALPDGSVIPAAPMTAVDLAVRQLREHRREIWENDEPTVRVDRAGRLVIGADPLSSRRHEMVGTRQRLTELPPDELDLFAPFHAIDGTGGVSGVDLRRPRPGLRIVPNKLSGEPHVEGSRVATLGLAGLQADGYLPAAIYELYPELPTSAIDQALDLELQLSDPRSRLQVA